MRSFIVGLLGFTLGYILAQNIAPTPQPVSCPVQKSEVSLFEQHYEKALRSCTSDDHTDYECIHYMSGGRFLQASPSPEPKFKWVLPRHMDKDGQD